MNALQGLVHGSTREPMGHGSLSEPALNELMSRPRDDLELLLRSRGIGPLVVQRLREVGVRSVLDLLRRGVEPTVQVICSRTGQPSWMNRTDALVQALTDVLRTPSSTGPSIGPSR